jgi:hypothetical protein
MSDLPLFEFGSWLNGVILDRWSLIHFLYGVVFAFLFRMIGLSRMKAYILAFIIMIGWEIYEAIGGPIQELIWNAVSDVIVASIGFLVGLSVFPNVSFWPRWRTRSWVKHVRALAHDCFRIVLKVAHYLLISAVQD